MPDLLLGLIGDNIKRSKAPVLHRLAGQLSGLDVQYDRLIPKDMEMDFDAVFERCRTGGYRGLNITYPYKEKVVPKLRIDDPLIAALGACNTVIFGEDGPTGHNTDYSGFVAAYRSVLDERAPGPVCMIGAGGVGKAVAFGLIKLGLQELRLVERDLPKADALAESLIKARPGLEISVTDDPAVGAGGASGLINCTPVGMVGYGGTPLPRELMTGAAWVFDAVYTPVETPFLVDAAAEGLEIISGYELFFHQGVDAWDFFAGRPVDQAALRQALIDNGAGPDAA